MGKKMKLTRRVFLVGGAAVGGGLLVGYGLMPDGDPLSAASLLKTGDGEVALNAWLKIAPDGTVTVAVPRSEMGQGIYTALPMLVAEELDADWSKVTVEQAPVDPIYANKTLLLNGLPFGPEETGMVPDSTRWAVRKVSEWLGILATGGSSSVRDAWVPMRQAGAAAREMLIGAAAKQWNVDAADCTAENGAVIHKASGRKAGYGELAATAATVERSGMPTLKDPKDYKLIGTSAERLDLPAKVDGTAEFGIDIRLPDMLYATVKASPVFGGTVKGFDAAAVKDMRGVEAVVEIPGAVAVVADSYWRAKQALADLPVEFDDGGNGGVSSESIRQQFLDALDGEDADSYRDDGDFDAAISTASTVVEAEYAAPFLAHATMEPMNCTVLVGDGTCEIWSPSQAPTLVQWTAADILEIESEQVTVHTPLLGGGFGRRAEMDVVAQAVAVAKQMPGRPVKLVWSREEDTQHDAYRPASISRFRAGLDGDGKPVAWWNRIASPSVTESYLGRHWPWAAMGGPDPSNVEGSADMPYSVADVRVEHVLSKTPVPVGYWRSVGHSQNAFHKESFIDEVAHAAGKDPYEYRLGLLGDHPRHAKVLETAAKAAGWRTPLPNGRGRGIALHESFASIVAEVAEVSVGADGAVKVDRVVCAIDCGIAVNPDTIVAQMESGIVYGLTAALFGEISIEDGRVVQENFPDYDMLRMAQMPVIETHIVESDGPIGGVGEPGTPPIAPAVTNAIFAATGNRIRSLPLMNQGLLVS